jgi:hypothetical protein
MIRNTTRMVVLLLIVTHLISVCTCVFQKGQTSDIFILNYIVICDSQVRKYAESEENVMDRLIIIVCKNSSNQSTLRDR